MGPFLKVTLGKTGLCFGLLQHLPTSSPCVPDGNLQVQLDFLIACEPASGPKSAGLQARQDENDSTHQLGAKTLFQLRQEGCNCFIELPFGPVMATRVLQASTWPPPQTDAVELATARQRLSSKYRRHL